MHYINILNIMLWEDGPQMLTEELKKKINSMSYEQLLRHNRFASAGDPMFVGEVGEYFIRVIAERRQIIGDAEHTATSKLIGWEK
jgi:hypothetical protein